ncbi:MAG TPA: hypothetical protein VN088_04065, partial [Nocardioides sp.]|nr:hypothetical protein [Nocardioides sp.]
MSDFVDGVSGVRRPVAASAVLTVLVSSLTVLAIQPTPASAAPSRHVVAPDSRPDGLSAAVAARAAGVRVEDLSARTATTQTFANPD